MLHLQISLIMMTSMLLNRIINILDLPITLHLTARTKKQGTNIFVFANCFSPIAPIIEDGPMDSTTINPVINENTITKPPIIFIQTQINYNNFCYKMNELTDSSRFNCISSIKGLQTYCSDSYRTVIKYLKNNNFSLHSHQLKKKNLLSCNQKFTIIQPIQLLSNRNS